MNVKKLLLAVPVMLLSTGIQASPQKQADEKKILIAYYSLRNGNTRIVAEEIQKNVGGDIFRIETVDAYPSVYNDVTRQAKKELESGYRPPLKSKVQDFDRYDIIYLGSPNWWNTIAPAVMTFLESYNFSGKTILPFVTHEGSRLGASVDDIKKLCPNSAVLKGLPIRGGNVENAGSDVQQWLRDNGMIK